ncbi:XRE family transcriptional regulator [Methylobacterium sp. WL64]|uniref:helix-turn-helix domain-containing protein n=1 Tax=Methylobacterium sp. WL64 TaxID=2603894 RepID=UPI0011C92952|nr:helix-turn-helix transcriptional regulator [Methylobacterium sp. WL64]TXM95973.1 XRE family transcriptional regulator [Methylobacterium sp. WL64]
MSDNEFELVRGSGNLFRDFNVPNPDLEQFRALLAGQIIKTLDARKLTVREAQEATGIDAGDFSRIRRVKLDRFTVDKLMTILGRLGQEVQLDVKVFPRSAHAASALAHP